MNELRALLEVAKQLPTSGSHLLATVVSVRGSAYRRPGARLLTSEDTRLAGAISGGCLERDVLRRGLWLTRNGSPALVTYDDSADEDTRQTWGIGCGGVVRVLLERLPPWADDECLRFLERCLSTERRGVIAKVFRSTGCEDAVGRYLLMNEAGIAAGHLPQALQEQVAIAARASLVSGASRELSCAASDSEVLVEVIEPPVRLFIFGAGYDVPPLAAVAAQLGMSLTVCASCSRSAASLALPPGTERRFGASEAAMSALAACPRAAAIVMNHDYERDSDTLAALLGSSARYIGVLGPRHRTERMLGELAQRDLLAQTSDRQRIHAPIGLDLGAQSAQEIALSIVAEVQAHFAGRSGLPLRERDRPIHEARIGELPS